MLAWLGTVATSLENFTSSHAPGIGKYVLMSHGSLKQEAYSQ